jgi:hypothetical protein
MVIALLLACDPVVREDPPALDGPAEIHVSELGPVDAPVIRRGGQPVEVGWTSSDPSVAVVDGSGIRAVGAGATSLDATPAELGVSVRLFVDLPVVLVPVDPPARLAVGESQTLRVDQRGEDGTIPYAGALDVVSSDPAVLRAEPSGLVTGVAPGVAFVTLTAPGGEAMVEIAVVP